MDSDNDFGRLIVLFDISCIFSRFTKSQNFFIVRFEYFMVLFFEDKRNKEERNQRGIFQK